MRRRLISSVLGTVAVSGLLSGSGMVSHSAGATASNPAVVGMAATPDGNGYWLVASDGGVFAYGDAAFRGSAGGGPLNKPVVGMAATPDGNGYWLVASDGGVFAYGDAAFRGSAGGGPLNKPVVGMAATADGNGYWLVASDGGVFAYGDAAFRGSAGGGPLNKPVVGMAATADGNGYWLVASDGGVFAYGDAAFRGSAGGGPLNKPVVDMAATADGNGYWLVASDGGVFAYGDAAFRGSAGGGPLNKPVVGMVATPDRNGYWLVGSDGAVLTYGTAGFFGQLPKLIALYGDSLGMEAAPFFSYLAHASGATALLRAVNGWAVCDDVQQMASDAATRHPAVAVIEFSGNAMTPCMSGYTMGSTPYYDKYRADMQSAIDIFRSNGIPVMLIAPPISAWANLAANVSFLNQIYASMAATNQGVAFVDAGQAVLANGRFTLTLPCLSFEPCVGPTGTNIVRSPDGVHFCPDGDTEVNGWFNVCDDYSSGAFRFALAMLGPALQY